jgi:chemotaxis response regulator CheB
VDFILRNLTPEVKVSVLVAQHMGRGFTPGLASWLAKGSPIPVVVAAQPVALNQPAVILAQDGHHLVVRGSQAHSLPSEGKEIAPNIDKLFMSVADYGPRAMGILLTGMGTDGAQGLSGLRSGGCVSVVQDASTSVVFGMPSAAIRLDPRHEVLPLEQIPPLIRSLTRER